MNLFVRQVPRLLAERPVHAANSLLKQMERGALLLLFFGIAFHSMLFYALGSDLSWLTSLLYTRYALLIALPACLFGCIAYRKHGGFARSLPVVAAVLLLSTALLWTEESELGRGLLNFALFAATLPIAALVIKHDYASACERAFVAGTAILFIKVAIDPDAQMLMSRFGYMQNSLGQIVSNPNAVGLQAGLAVLIVTLWTLYPEPYQRRCRLHLIVGSVGVAFFSYFTIHTASRTAFVALGGVLLWIFLKRSLSSPVAIVTVGLLCVVLAASIVAFDVGLSGGGPGALDRINERLFRDAEDTVSTLGGRTQIWTCAWDQLYEQDRWLLGYGTGGVDKQLGLCFQLGYYAPGRDGIKRVHSHNTLVEWVMMAGLLGMSALIWLVVRAVLTARWQDRRDGGCRRTSLLIFTLLLSVGSVATTLPFWLALGPLLWAMLSRGRRRSKPTVLPIYEITVVGRKEIEGTCVHETASPPSRFRADH